MNTRELEHMWKVASNNPNHDTNWHDPVVVAFAKMVAAHTLMNIDPSNFMSHQEGFEAGRVIERESILDLVDDYAKNNTDLIAAIRARSKTEPVQEPVACVQDLDEVKRKHLVYEKGMDWKDPLYTTPPAAQRQWVSLTDEEHRVCTQSPFTAENYRAIEAKLREKNT